MGRGMQTPGRRGRAGLNPAGITHRTNPTARPANSLNEAYDKDCKVRTIANYKRYYCVENMSKSGRKIDLSNTAGQEFCNTSNRKQVKKPHSNYYYMMGTTGSDVLLSQQEVQDSPACRPSAQGVMTTRLWSMHIVQGGT